MFSFFKKNPVKQLEGEYRVLLEKALHAQRRGDIRTYSDLTTQAEAKSKELDKLTAN